MYVSIGRHSPVCFLSRRLPSVSPPSHCALIEKIVESKYKIVIKMLKVSMLNIINSHGTIIPMLLPPLPSLLILQLLSLL